MCKPMITYQDVLLYYSAQTWSLQLLLIVPAPKDKKKNNCYVFYIMVLKISEIIMSIFNLLSKAKLLCVCVFSSSLFFIYLDLPFRHVEAWGSDAGRGALIVQEPEPSLGREALLPAVCRLQSVGGLRQWEAAGTAGDSFTVTGLTVQTNNQHPPLPFSNYSLHQNLLEGNTDGWSPPPEFLAGLS